MNEGRRRFLIRASLGSLGVAGGYPLLEAKWCRLTRQTIRLPNLPPAFRGITAALVTDVHHGPYVPLAYVREVVAMTNDLRPDIVLLVGDYVSKSRQYTAPSIELLGRLRAPLGRFSVLGNHDNWESTPATIAALDEAGITRLDNTGTWLERGTRGDRLRICGVGDLWTDFQHPHVALADATDRDAVIMLSHNPDFAEYFTDRRVGLMLSGHTHGGQIFVPGYGPPILPSQFGQKYAYGLVRGPNYQVYVSRGVGTSGPPVRFLCRPEVVLLTLV